MTSTAVIVVGIGDVDSWSAEMDTPDRDVRHDYGDARARSKLAPYFDYRLVSRFFRLFVYHVPILANRLANVKGREGFFSIFFPLPPIRLIL